MKDLQIVFRRYRDGDEFSIVRLLSVIWPGVDKWRDTRFWRWRYKENPFGHSLIWLAEHENELVGHRGVVPTRLKAGYVEVLAGQVTDVGVHPKYRRQGIHTRLSQACTVDSGLHGFKLSFGLYFTTRLRSYSKYEKIGRICFMTPLIKPLNVKGLLKKVLRLRQVSKPAKQSFSVNKPRAKRISIFRVKEFDERFDDFWNRISPFFPIIVRRDSEYLTWRYLRNPETNYVIYAAEKDNRILGYCVLRKRQIHARDFAMYRISSKLLREPLLEGLIVDFLGYEPAVEALIWEAEEYFRNDDVDILHCRLSEGNCYVKSFLKMGFLEAPWLSTMALSAGMHMHGTPVNKKRIFTEAMLLSQNIFFKAKKNWFVTHGDSDGV